MPGEAVSTLLFDGVVRGAECVGESRAASVQLRYALPRTPWLASAAPSPRPWIFGGGIWRWHHPRPQTASQVGLCSDPHAGLPSRPLEASSV